MNKIQRVSRFFRILFQLGFILLPVLLFAGWAYGPDIHVGTSRLGMGFTAYPRSMHIIMPLNPIMRFQGFLISLLPMAASMFLLYCLIQLFYCYERGEIFTLKTVNYIRNIGITLIVQVVIDIIYLILLSLFFSDGLQTISINFSSVNLSVVILALLIILNSWIMKEGYKLHMEQALTI